MRLISIDPGVKYFAYAAFDDGLLILAERRDVDSAWAVAHYFAPRQVVCEKPVVYGGRPSNIVIDIAIAASTVVTSMQIRSTDILTTSDPESTVDIVYYTPSQWKGNMRKDDHQRDVILPTLTAKELKLIDTTVSKRTKKPRWDKDVIDAVGIGLYHLGRLPKV